MSTHFKSHELPAFFRQHRDRLRDRAFLVEALRPHVRIRRMNWYPQNSKVRLIQFPEEFASLMAFAAEKGVRSYLEIGVSSGGSLYTMDAYLRALFPDYVRSVGVDPIKKARYLDEYRKECPTLEFRHTNSKSLVLTGERYDLAFVDARHVEKWVLHDFQKVRGHAKYVAFHDIELQGSSVGLAWAKIKAEFPTRWVEFVDQSAPPEARCGIGLVEIGS